MFSVEAMVCGYHGTRRLGIHLLKILSCEREVGNIHNIFVVVIAKDGKGSAGCPYFSSFLSNFKADDKFAYGPSAPVSVTRLRHLIQ